MSLLFILTEVKLRPLLKVCFCCDWTSRLLHINLFEAHTLQTMRPEDELLLVPKGKEKKMKEKQIKTDTFSIAF